MSIIEWARSRGLSPQDAYYHSRRGSLSTYGSAPKKVKVAEADEWYEQRIHPRPTIDEFFIGQVKGRPPHIGKVVTNDTFVVLETSRDKSLDLRENFERGVVTGQYAIVDYEFVVRLLTESLRNSGRPDLADKLKELGIETLNRPE